MRIKRVPIKPPPHRVCDVECENYGEILWLHKGKFFEGAVEDSEWWDSTPNPCPLGEIGDMYEDGLGTFRILDIQVTGGPQIAAPEKPWRWEVTLEKIR